MRYAFTIIELIISIVVIGISILTLPLIIRQTTNSDAFLLNQDSFFKAQALMKEITSKYWDASIISQDTNGNGVCFVDVSNGDTLLARASGTNYRIGSFSSDNSMRKFYSNTTNASQIMYSGTLNAVEQFNGYSTSANGVTLNVSVDYVPDGATRNGNTESIVWSLSGGASSLSNSTNLKRITITTTKTIGQVQTNTTFVYFSANIGGQVMPSK